MARAYRKKPVVVEAVQWTGNNHADMCEFIDPEVFEIIPRVGLVIHTLEGDHHASPGDYIIKGVNGEFYPCKPDIFAKTYEADLPTLTPPNEALTLEELREMGGQPYWHVGLREESPPPHWNILDPFYAKRIEDYKYGENWIAYRRPPEGEEATNGT